MHVYRCQIILSRQHESKAFVFHQRQSLAIGIVNRIYQLRTAGLILQVARQISPEVLVPEDALRAAADRATKTRGGEDNTTSFEIREPTEEDQSPEAARTSKLGGLAAIYAAQPPRLVSATGRRACLDGDRGRRHVLDRPTRVVRLTHGHTTYRRPSRSSNSASTARAPPITRFVNTYRRLVNTPPLRPAATAKSIFDPIKQPYRLPRKPRIASQPDSPARMTVGAPTVSQNRYGYGLRRLAIIPVRSDRALGG